MSAHEKLLTIAVPAYNAAEDLPNCLASFLDGESMEDLEVIVVNDGSTDHTCEVAASFESRYPAVFRVVSQQNSGHGGAINTAVRLARGRYFKVIDADDWIPTENLKLVLGRLRGADADVVLTSFRKIIFPDKETQPFEMQGILFGKVYTLEALLKAGWDILKCCCFHGIMYNTAFYRETKTILTEKVFYEDQEYAALPFRYVKTVLPLKLFFYEYRIGRAGQSIAAQTQVRRAAEIEHAFLMVQNAYFTAQTEAAREYILFRLREVAVSYLAVMLVKNPDRKKGRQLAKQFYAKLRTNNRVLAQRIRQRYFLLCTMNALRLNAAQFEKMKGSGFYKRLRRVFG